MFLHKILSVYEKIAKTSFINVKKIEYPNESVQAGVFGDAMGSQVQVPLMYLRVTQPIMNLDVDTSHQAESGKGEIYIPESKDYWMGDGV